MKKIALILCLVLVASFVLSGCNNSDSIITLEDREVGKIEIQSGNTGETVEVTEEEVISQIADILSLEFEKGEKSNDSTGWSYSVRWYDTEAGEAISRGYLSDRQLDGLRVRLPWRGTGGGSSQRICRVLPGAQSSSAGVQYGAAHGRGHAPPPCGLRAGGNGAEPGPLNEGINETSVKAARI